jgi:hypothetical protein
VNARANPSGGRGGGRPEPAGLRAAIERKSAAPIVFLHGLPRWVPLVAIFLLLAVGMVGTGWVGASGLLALFAVLAWFAYLNWPALDAPGRILRVVALAVLAAFAIGHLI